MLQTANLFANSDNVTLIDSEVHLFCKTSLLSFTLQHNFKKIKHLIQFCFVDKFSIRNLL